MSTTSFVTSFVLIFSFLSGVAMAETSLQDWMDRDRAYRQNLAILSAQGKEDAAGHRSEAQSVEATRIEALGKDKAVTEERVREAERDKELAQVKYEAAGVEVAIARDEKGLDAFEAGCRSGKLSDCAHAEQSYAEIFRAREDLAALEVRKAQAKLDFETFQFHGIEALAEASAIDSGIVPEEQARLDARQAELESARKQLQLAKQAAD